MPCSLMPLAASFIPAQNLTVWRYIPYILWRLTPLLDTIRYLSTHDNSYLRYFEGHEDNVTCLSLHPGQDNFLSCSEDNTLRIWDAATKNACGKLDLNGAYLSAWDPSGNVFAVASPTAQSIL